MMNIHYAHNGYFIAAELDQKGTPTGRALVLDKDGKVVHIAASFEDALKWTEENVARAIRAIREKAGAAKGMEPELPEPPTPKV
jgi:hypothetical protein